ncbi:MAG: hypothetical protein AB7G12_16425 [Thermoanaerobaculia bacterium]
MPLANLLMTASVSIIGLLGLAHLVLTFRGPKLLPRDPDLAEAMKRVSPVITSQTTIWRAWLGFNASHSFGAMLFGLVYGYLAIVHGELLFASTFLLAVGFVLLAGFLVLAKLYWFRTPLAGAALSLCLYVAAVVLAP